MYAIIVDGGRHYKVVEGQELNIDYRDIASGEPVRFEQVSVVSDGSDVKLGSPSLKGAAVTAKVLGIEQGPKLTVQKFRRRKNMRRRTGHRQMYTRIKIDKISLGS